MVAMDFARSESTTEYQGKSGMVEHHGDYIKLSGLTGITVGW